MDIDIEETDKYKAMKESIISSVIIYVQGAKGVEIHKSDPDTREYVKTLVESMMEDVSIDESSWSYVGKHMLYDVYLKMREDEGTLTALDLRRPGLNLVQFTCRDAYNSHQKRLSDYKVDAKSGSKICSKCQVEKLATSFRRRGGTTCNACRCKDYRRRKQGERLEKLGVVDDDS